MRGLPCRARAVGLDASDTVAKSTPRVIEGRNLHGVGSMGTATAIRVIDGDTVVVAGIHVRLKGVLASMPPSAAARSARPRGRR